MENHLAVARLRFTRRFEARMHHPAPGYFSTGLPALSHALKPSLR